ncbi:MAG: thiamine-phosphate kinase, partial [Akkermansiaceae bacterium]|nr:thiamine-phosphate kinase [Akkermansiaceae bacterium]
MTTLRDIGEDALIQRITRLLPRPADPLAGPGDDCAVVASGPDSPTLLLLKTDALVAGIHFAPDADPQEVGWKAVARVVSDFAAMGGGDPGHFLITVALPPTTAVEWVEELYRGMARCLETCGGTLAGGETTAVPPGSAAVVTVAATATIPRERLVLRSTALPGDLVLVTGTLGGSLSGRHLTFPPRLAEAQWLSARHHPTAMMDLSDGLAKDLPRLAAASGCGFRIEPGRIPVTPG